MARNNRGRNNNNPEGRNQYSGGWMDGAKERPYTTAAVAAATVGAGVFLWSRRNQISDQLSGLSEQISDWTSNMRSDSSGGDLEMETADSGGGASMNRGTQSRSGSSRSRSNATSGSTGSTAQSGSSGTNRQEPVG